MKKKRRYLKKSAPAHSRRVSLTGWICILAIIGFLTAVGYVWYHCGGGEPTDAIRKDAISRGRRSLDEHQREGLPKGARTKMKAGNRVAFIIDDMGYDVPILHEILALDIPIAISILPHLPHSATVARTAHGAGREVLLHLPMEPHDYPKRQPGEGALLLRMSGEEILAQLEEDILSVPHISGVNNHMGSSFMEDEEKVTVVLQDLKKRGLFFLDSLTTRNSKGVAVAQKIGLPHAGRDIFIDNDCDFEQTRGILDHIVEEKDQWETMIIIGHPYESTVRALGEAVALFRYNDISIVPLADLIE